MVRTTEHTGGEVVEDPQLTLFFIWLTFKVVSSSTRWLATKAAGVTGGAQYISQHPPPPHPKQNTTKAKRQKGLSGTTGSVRLHGFFSATNLAIMIYIITALPIIQIVALPSFNWLLKLVGAAVVVVAWSFCGAPRRRVVAARHRRR